MNYFWKFVITCFLFALPSLGFAQVSNDECASAKDLGRLPSPAPCNDDGTGGQGTKITVNGTNIGANYEPSAPLGLANCSGNQAQQIPAADVWYKFKASGNKLDFSISSSDIKNINVALWIGSCGNLSPVACEISSNGIISTTFSPLSPNFDYYIQIHGKNLSEQGTFTMNLTNSNSCDICLLSSTLEVTPPPTNGYYKSNVEVNFCYYITEFKIVAENWLHGIEPKFGESWDLSTLQTTPSEKCTDNNGKWGWYNQVKSNIGNKTFGPGFFFEQSNDPNNPGDNFGDKCEGNTPWKFCWRIRTKQQIACKQGADLGIQILNYSDGESGAWSSPACTQDPNYIFIAGQDCCEKPELTSTNSCENLSTGSITIQGNGTGPWRYVIRDINGVLVDESPTINGSYTADDLPPGTYTAYAVDSKGCEKFGLISIGSSPSPVLTLTTKDPKCEGSCDGEAEANVNGGTSPFKYKWSNGATTKKVSSFCGEITYEVEVTDNAGCVLRKSFMLVDPEPITLKIDRFVDVKCYQVCNGEANLSGEGGVLPYQFKWSDGINGNVRKDLCGDKRYNIVLEDANGCTADTFIITKAPAEIIIAKAVKNEECESKNGSINLTVSGGASPYAFNWDDGTKQEDRNNLSAGIYIVTVLDNFGCKKNDTIEVDRFSNITFTTQVTNVSCFEGSDGEVLAISANATPPLKLDPGFGTPANPFTGIPAGTYEVTLIDAKKCTAVQTVKVNQPDTVKPNASITNVSCFGDSDGSVLVNPSGGNGGFTYNWSSGSNTNTITNKEAGTYQLEITDSKDCEYNFEFTIGTPDPIRFDSLVIFPEACLGEKNGKVEGEIIGGNGSFQIVWNDLNTDFPRTNMAPGIYQLSVTDSKGCKADTTIEIKEPSSQLIAQVQQIGELRCFGDSTAELNVFASGGEPPYQFRWSTGSFSTSISDLKAGVYIVSITDSFLCEITVVKEVIQPDSITSNPIISDAICKSSNGSIDPNITGGTLPYFYTWSGPISSNQPIISNIPSGVYQLLLQDKNDCFNSFEYEVKKSGFIRIDAIIDSITCNGYTDGRIFADIFNGTPPYSFIWSTGETTQGIDSLSVGNYSVSATDSNGCEHDTIIEVFEPEPPVFDYNFTLPVCFGDTNGAIEVLAMENVQLPFELIWSTNSTQNPLTDIAAGEYQLTIIDVKNCEYYRTAILEDPEQVKVNAGSDKTVLENNNTGITVRVSPFDSYKISITPNNNVFQSGDSTFLITPDSTNSYIITAVSPLGCTNTDTVIIKVIDQNYIYIPSAFSPNSDGINDLYYIKRDFEPLDFKATIFNRWGNIVFKTTDPSIGWNGLDGSGNRMSSSLFIVLIEYVDPNSLEEVRIMRQLTLVR